MKMKARAKTMKEKNTSPIVGSIAKGTLIALCVSLILVLIFAFLLKFTNIPDTIISPVNQIIKGVSIFLGVFIGKKSQRNWD